MIRFYLSAYAAKLCEAFLRSWAMVNLTMALFHFSTFFSLLYE